MVNTTYFGQRRVDFWAPPGPTQHLIIAHDGQNIFDHRSATYRSTWKLAQTANRVFNSAQLPAPIIIGVFHSSSKSDPNGRGKDLTPMLMAKNVVPQKIETAQKAIHASALADNFK
jgi:hypothetical protein